MNDFELTIAALEACGYRVHIKERNGTRWITACKGLEVQYRHWHPLTNIHQAMQLLTEAPARIVVHVCPEGAWVTNSNAEPATTPQAIINAQCRAIINACATLKRMK